MLAIASPKMPDSGRSRTGLKYLSSAIWERRGGMVSGVLGTLLLRFSAAIFAFLSTFILTRYLGATGYGVYAWAFAWASVLQMAGTLGFDVLAIREFAAQRATSTWTSMHGFLCIAPRVVLRVSLLIAVSGVAAGALFVASPQRLTYIVAVSLVPILALTAIRLGAVQGLGSVAAARLPDDLVGPIVFVVLLLLGWRLFGLTRNAPTAMVLQGCSLCFAFLVGLAALWRLIPPQVRHAPVNGSTRDLVRMAVPLGLVNSIAVLLAQVDVILLGILSSSRQVGLYSTSARIASVVGMAEFAVNAAYLPAVARLYAANRTDRLQAGAPLVTLVAVLLSSTLAAPLIAFAPNVLKVFGGGFTDGVFILRVLCLTFVVSAVAGQNGSLLMMTRQTRPVITSTCIALVVNLCLNAIFIPIYGGRGAAVAWLLSVTIWNGIMSLYVKRIYGFTVMPYRLLGILRRRGQNSGG